MYTLRADDRRRSRRPINALRLRPYVERQYSPDISMCFWFPKLGLHDGKSDQEYRCRISSRLQETHEEEHWNIS